VVALLEDVEYVDDLDKLAVSCDALIKKYKKRLHFVYLVQQPNAFEDKREDVKAGSSVLDAVIYSRIGQSWDLSTLNELAIKQFKKELAKEIVDEIFRESGGHYGIFMRLYRDRLLGTDHTDAYINNLISEFTVKEVNLFKKIASNTKLNNDDVRL